MTYARFSSLPRNEALQVLSSRILNNFTVTEKIIYFCKASGFSNYRLSSDLTPVINHPDVNLRIDQLPDSDKIFDALSGIKQAIKNTSLKVSAHPSEFISLTSSNEEVIRNSFRDLSSHAELFDLIGLPQSYEAPLNIHCRQDGDPESVSSAFLKNFDKLPNNVKNRLVLEVNDNKEGTWTISNLYQHFYKKAGIPITFDNLHHSFCHGGLSESEAFEQAYTTWSTIPIFHYSEGVANTRKHAEYAVGLPNGYDKQVFWDVELKGKDLAIFKMLEKYE